MILIPHIFYLYSTYILLKDQSNIYELLTFGGDLEMTLTN